MILPKFFRFAILEIEAFKVKTMSMEMAAHYTWFKNGYVKGK